MKGLRHTSLLLVILLCIGLNQLILGQSKGSTDETASVSIVKAKTLRYQADNNLSETLSSFVWEEPLQMMFYGLILFIAATALRRMMRSRDNVKTPINVNKV